MSYKQEQVKSQLILYIMKQKEWKSFEQKYIKMIKTEYVFKGFTSTYNVENLNYFNP